MDAKDLLAKLISFNTIADKENAAIMDFIEEYLSKCGFVTDYRSRCLVMHIGDRHPIGFLGHTDTVSCSDNWKTNPHELFEEDGNLYGLGACDMKGGIAAMLATVAKIDWKNHPGMKLFFTFDEETDFGGIIELVDKGIAFPDKMIFGEPTNNELVNSSKGLITGKIIFKGKAVHSSTPEKGVSAIMNCAEFIHDFRERMSKETATLNIGLINGGRAVNIVPERCEISFDSRTNKPDQNALIEGVLQDLCRKYDGQYEVAINLPSFVAEKDANMCDYITEASFVDSKERLILGVGPINPHVDNEYITIKSLKKLEQQYSELISSC